MKIIKVLFSLLLLLATGAWFGLIGNFGFLATRSVVESQLHDSDSGYLWLHALQGAPAAVCVLLLALVLAALWHKEIIALLKQDQGEK
ncbi:hypothetical protein SAMN02745857_02775 [Andreprevotia lacus DSM 23236]|jgi:hypothetical protein|uniref:Uncharacterized protein n=1 Tax=Andreprevotia lacus DSM 23236 TaxID=1121001 RepID=A0A1W1XUP6_9NEIS|nr:hypothetical protein [Andreprevotia lacus]SMC27261.1 hypothetical protein SAMN02745857_02775 [Andreprevotia lacus DSM 23236]